MAARFFFRRTSLAVLLLPPPEPCRAPDREAVVDLELGKSYRHAARTPSYPHRRKRRHASFLGLCNESRIRGYCQLRAKTDRLTVARSWRWRFFFQERPLRTRVQSRSKKLNQWRNEGWLQNVFHASFGGSGCFFSNATDTFPKIGFAGLRALP